MKQVRDLVGAGAVLAVDECSSGSSHPLTKVHLRPQVVTSEMSHKLARGKHPDSVIFAPTLWRGSGSRDALVVLGEEAPNRRKIIAERREPYSFPFTG